VAAGADEVKVEVVGVFEQEVSVGNQEQRVPLLLLRDDVSRELRLPIGSCEGLAIQIALDQRLVPRPLTHDLAVRLLDRLSARLERVVVDELTSESTHATLHLHSAEGGFTMDARPGDAVALALRAEVPVFVREILLISEEGGDASR
jgi:bifunctional DNase/RNase